MGSRAERGAIGGFHDRPPARSWLGLLAIGQTPRDDLWPTLRAILGEDVHIRQAGGLDGLTWGAIEDLIAREGEVPLETRLRSGRPIVVSRERIIPYLVSAGRALQRQCGVVMLLCSGNFPVLTEACPGLIEPGRLLHSVVAALARNRRVGLIGPASDLERAAEVWQGDAPAFIAASASPYGDHERLLQAAAELAEGGAELLVLDDMGFTMDHQDAVAATTGLPVLCATTLAARLLCEIL